VKPAFVLAPARQVQQVPSSPAVRARSVLQVNWPPTCMTPERLRADEPIVALCTSIGVDVFRGHPTDLLARHYWAARMRGADVVVKIPSDCPLVDPRIIDRVISFYMANPHDYDFVSNLHPATYPDGNDVEVISFEALEKAFRLACRPIDREHTTPFFWTQPERFRIGNVRWGTGLDYSLSHRWVVDYPEDYELVRRIYQALEPIRGSLFSLRDILALVSRWPFLMEINAAHRGSSWMAAEAHELCGSRTHAAELEERIACNE
ncbi:MAG: hypothetical protein JXA30_11920, partial [Deltaproteobacteria bacterium]|nr:hypothetical protein [Deltaproteobacteria bacterium]